MSVYMLLADQLGKFYNIYSAEEQFRLENDVMYFHYSNAEFMNS
jgi:hypothetical protein